MVALLSRWLNRRDLSLLGSATRSVPDFIRTDLRTVRLAIATWKNGASRVNDCKAIGGLAGGNDCAQGWAGENGDRSGTALHPRKSQAVTPTTRWEEGEQASSAGAFVSLVT
jgi:hypothetical protein